MAEPHFFGDADVTPLAAAALAVWLLIFLWRSWKLLRPASACSDGLEYALALRSAAVYVLGICSVPLLFPCRSAPEEPVSSWATCSKSPYSFIPTNLMRIFHILPFWYAFLVTPYLGGLVKSICDAILGVSLGLVAVSFLNLMLPGGAAGPEYLTSDYFERAWLPFRYSTPAAFLLALCLTYGLFVSNLSVAKKQYAMCIYSELLVPFMSPHTRTGFRAVCWDWDFQWNWNGSAMCGFWLVSLAVLLSIITLGMLPTRRSIETHTAKWASALALAQLAEDTAGCLEYLMTILQQEAWKFQFHADSSNFYIKHLGLRRTRAEAILALTPWEPKESKNLTKVASFLRQLRQLLRIQSEQMRYFGQSMPKGKQLKLEDFLLACNDGLSLVARDCRSNADLTEETCEELKRIAEKADEILIQTLRDIEDDQMASIQMAFVDKLRSWPAAFRALGGVTSGASSESNETWSNRNWFALRNTTSWLLALLWSLYFRNYSCGCVVATSLIFSQTSGSSFEVNINRLLGICMGLAVGNIPALLIFSSTDPAADLTSVNYLLRVFMYFVVMFTTWTLAIFGYLATDSKYFRACLMWAALSGTEMFRHLPRVGMLDVQLFTAILDNVLAVMVVFMVDMVFAYMQGNDASEQVKAAVTRCIQRIATQLDTLKVQGIRELQLDTLQRDIKDARFWDSEIQKEGLVWTRLWKNAYKAESVPALLDHFDEVYVWLNAVQNSGSRCDPELAAKIVRDLPKSVVERCHTFVRAIKLVLQGLDDSLHRELHHLLEGSKRDSPEMGISSQSICNMLQGDAAEGTASDMESSPAESHPDDVAQRAAAHAVHLSVKALRMTLQKIGGLLAAGSALAAKDWGVEARRRNAKGEQSFTMDDFMVPKSKSGDLRRRLRSSVKALVLALEQRRFKAGRRPAKKRGQKESPQKQETDPQVNVTLKDLRVEAKELRRAHRAVSASETKSLGGFWHTPSPCRQREFVCPVCGSGGGVSLTPLDVSHQSADFERLELEKAILEKKAIGLQWKLRSHDQDILDLQADLKGAYGLCQELHGQLKKQTDEFQSFMVGVRASIGHWTAHQHQLKEEMDELADQCAPGHAEVVKLAEELQLARQKLQASQRRKSRRESTKQHQATIQALQLRIRELGHEDAPPSEVLQLKKELLEAEDQNRELAEALEAHEPDV
ncbi:unnamed protein product [Cladocopium goreaui]|uniref:Phosphoglucomutase (Alpha-D-glucose-1,6-bisphosphate-dependent) n=1 Tax=Cladocopium goreaui TaxID=2562237 RepID=A0A9P1CUM2_9DINO|nr:unnamed protein product [Cladocopium goreaui]